MQKIAQVGLAAVALLAMVSGQAFAGSKAPQDSIRVYVQGGKNSVQVMVARENTTLLALGKSYVTPGGVYGETERLVFTCNKNDKYCVSQRVDVRKFNQIQVRTEGGVRHTPQNLYSWALCTGYNGDQALCLLTTSN